MPLHLCGLFPLSLYGLTSIGLFDLLPLDLCQFTSTVFKTVFSRPVVESLLLWTVVVASSRFVQFASSRCIKSAFCDFLTLKIDAGQTVAHLWTSCVTSVTWFYYGRSSADDSIRTIIRYVFIIFL